MQLNETTKNAEDGDAFSKVEHEHDNPVSLILTTYMFQSPWTRLQRY